jgi:hypothetical protein
VPFFDIAACVDPRVRADQRTVDDVLERVEAGGRNVARVVPYTVHWAALRPVLGEAFDEVDRAGSVAQFGYVVGPLD